MRVSTDRRCILGGIIGGIVECAFSRYAHAGFSITESGHIDQREIAVAAGPSAGDGAKRFDKSSNGLTVNIAAGETFWVTLPENPTTGYRWALASDSNSSFEVVDSRFAVSGPGVGQGGMRTLVLKPRSAGTHALKLHLWREWEGESSIIDRYALGVTVQ